MLTCKNKANLTLFVRFRVVFEFLFVLFKIAWWPSAGKELSFWYSACTVLRYPSIVLLSLFVSGARCGIPSYWFLFIAFSSTFQWFYLLYLQSSKVSLDHIESRLTKKKGSQFDVILQCTGNKDTITSLTNTLRQSNSISDIWIGNENIVQKKGTPER